MKVTVETLADGNCLITSVLCGIGQEQTPTLVAHSGSTSRTASSEEASLEEHVREQGDTGFVVVE
jgi:hypothetical protein